jgi:hypothetical protein
MVKSVAYNGNQEPVRGQGHRRAVANAVGNAIGVRIHDLPLTPEKVLAALDRAKRQGDTRTG